MPKNQQKGLIPSMKKILNKWNDIPLVARILIGLVLGAVLGLTVPQASVIGILGDVFVGGNLTVDKGFVTQEIGA